MVNGFDDKKPNAERQAAPTMPARIRSSGVTTKPAMPRMVQALPSFKRTIAYGVTKVDFRTLKDSVRVQKPMQIAPKVSPSSKTIRSAAKPPLPPATQSTTTCRDELLSTTIVSAPDATETTAEPPKDDTAESSERRRRPRSANVTASPTDLMNEAEFCHRLGIAPQTARNWRVKGYGPPYIQISSRCIRYDRHEVKSWTAARVKGSTSEGGSNV